MSGQAIDQNHLIQAILNNRPKYEAHAHISCPQLALFARRLQLFANFEAVVHGLAFTNTGKIFVSNASSPDADPNKSKMVVQLHNSITQNDVTF